ncbi:MAG: protease modulator HflK [Planctomycetota bacterium]|nr:MAG: protease modulator HflK [Planctomycetota bacterium]
MSRKRIALLTVALAAYLLTGLYVVRSDEKALVRRCGRLLRTDGGAPRLIPAGIHWDLPWPFTTVDRVRVNEVRTLSVGVPEVESIESDQFLPDQAVSRRSQFLSGDKNVLNMYFTVQYRVDEARIDRFLFGSLAPEQHLRRAAEAAMTDAVMRSGVDFVHTLGHAELRQYVLQRLTRFVESQRLGLVIEDVAIGSVYPPTRVKAEFLDVMNARADRETYIHQARAYAEERRAAAQAEAQKIRDLAEAERHREVELAAAEADRFRQLIRRLQEATTDTTDSYEHARALALQREYLDVLESVLRRVTTKVLLDDEQPVDLTILKPQ